MSRFIDKLVRVLRGGQPMGFRAAAAPKPRMLLIASLAQADVEPLADYVTGADAALLAVSKPSLGAKSLKKACQVVSDIPWGGWLRDVGKEEMGKLAEAGGDFIVFPAATASLFGEEKLGKVLEIEPSLDEGLLKAIDDLPIDAVLVAGEEKKLLTWHHLMLFQRCANLISKPLLVLVPFDVVAKELQALWEAGVRGVVVQVGIDQPKGRLAELRQVIDKLPLPSPGKRRKAEPLLPGMGGETGAVSEEEE